MSSIKINTRDRILKATWKLMMQHNGQGVRMTDIAKHIGISRQALYLHFGSRTELMIATTHYVDEVLGLEERLKHFQSLSKGVELLEEYVQVWGNYLPEIYGIGKVLIQLKDTDKAANAAWNDRMTALRNGCEKIIDALNHDGLLSDEWSSPKEAVDMFWTTLSLHNWQQLTVECGWTTSEYIARITAILKHSFIR